MRPKPKRRQPWRLRNVRTRYKLLPKQCWLLPRRRNKRLLQPRSQLLLQNSWRALLVSNVRRPTAVAVELCRWRPPGRRRRARRRHLKLCSKMAAHSSCRLLHQDFYQETAHPRNRRLAMWRYVCCLGRRARHCPPEAQAQVAKSWP